MFNWNKKKIEELEVRAYELSKNNILDQQKRINGLEYKIKTLTDRVERMRQDNLEDYRRNRWIEENPRKFKKGDSVLCSFPPYGASTGYTDKGRIMSHLLTKGGGEYYWEYKVINCETMDTEVFNENNLSLCKK